MESQKPDQPPEPEPEPEQPPEPVEEDIVDDAVALKDRAMAVVSRETNDFVGNLLTRFKDRANEFFDRLEGKK